MPGKLAKPSSKTKGSGGAGKGKRNGGVAMSDTEAKVKELEAGVYEGAANANNIVDLLELCQV